MAMDSARRGRPAFYYCAGAVLIGGAESHAFFRVTWLN